MGLHRAGFEVIGIDLDEWMLKDYPLKHFRADVFSDFVWALLPVVDFIWSSPPCQRYSKLTRKVDQAKYVDLVDSTRQLLNQSGKPYVIENVTQAPIRQDLVLCGQMFGLPSIRHRAFEVSGFKVSQPEHPKHAKLPSSKYYCAGHLGNVKTYSEALGIDWMTNRDRLAEAIPPAYSEYIGRSFLEGGRNES